jgi:hypothetical protein
MPGVSGVTVVTNARAFYTTRAAAGASGARHSLRPLLIRRRKIQDQPRANLRRDREAMFAHEGDTNTLVMPGPDLGIHQSSQKEFSRRRWIAGSSPATTV